MKRLLRSFGVRLRKIKYTYLSVRTLGFGKKKGFLMSVQHDAMVYKHVGPHPLLLGMYLACGLQAILACWHTWQNSLQRVACCRPVLSSEWQVSTQTIASITKS